MMQLLLKLRKMSSDEIRVRIVGELRRHGERRSWRRVVRATAHRNGTDLRSSVDGFGLPAAAARLVPGASPAKLVRLRELFPEFAESIRSQTASRAKNVLSGKWMMLGHEFDLTGPIDWHCDPRSDFRWERKFYGDLPLYNVRGEVDVKYVWELGRQQYLAELARAWLLEDALGEGSQSDGRGIYAVRVREIMLDWIAQNPQYEGIHWTSGLEVAMRSISWLWSLAGLATWNGWSDRDLSTIATSLAEHAEYLEHHFSFYSSPYNHLIGEATALYLLGLALPDEPAADRWQRRGREVLVEYGPRQFYADGFCVEQATGYHFYTLAFLSLALAAGRSQSEPIEELGPVVQRAYGAGAAFRQPDGRWPAIGDVDSARAIPVEADDFWDFGSLCALGAVLFNEGRLKSASTEPGEELYWLLGCDGVATWHALQAETADACTVLEDSGYAIARSGGDWLLIDAGPIADGVHADATPSAAHGHADALQVLYFAEGRSILHDSGMPFYGGDPKWVEHFRSPAAHNTLEIEGVEMARSAGGLAWSHVAPRPQLDVKMTDGAWLAAGRAEWASGVVVERHLLCLPGDGLWIADWIETDRPRCVRWYWQFSNMLQLRNATENYVCLRSERRKIEIATHSPQAIARFQTQVSAEGNPSGWSSNGYGCLDPANRLSVHATSKVHLLLTTSLVDSERRFEIRIDRLALVCNRDTPQACLVAGPKVNRELSHGRVTWRELASSSSFQKFENRHHLDSQLRWSIDDPGIAERS